MTDNCDLTLYVLSKGGTACVFGTCQNSLNWSALATDFLVINLMSNPRYQKVVCLNFESTNLVSRFDTLSACSGKRGSSERPATSNPPPILSNHLPAKLTVITAQYSDAESQYTVKNAKEKEEQEANIETVGMWDTVLAEIAASLAAGGDSPSARSAPLITVGASGNVAVVIYSLSELILTVGLAETRNFIRKLSLLLQNTNTTRTASQQQQPSCGPESSAAPTTRASTITSTHAPTATMPLPTPTTALVPCILLPVHQSLHGPAVLAQIQALASVLVRVVPNSGTLADTVACEIQTVRRSGTGKISESTEMFGCAQGLLYPLKPTTGTATAASINTGAGAGTAGAAGKEKQDNMAVEGAGTAPALPTRESAAAAPAAAPGVGAAVVPGAANQRLITFDSTDPEFDEDSDPDADLDL